MYRGPGIGGMQRHAMRQKRMETLGEQMETGSITSMQRQIEQFQLKLQEFAVKHKEKINKNPLFRAKFHKMCHSIGVDPLASNKGLWAQSLGMGDFYYELAVQVIEICLRTRAQNGGIISVDDMVTMLRNRRSKKLVVRGSRRVQAQVSESATVVSDITAADVREAVSRVGVLGSAHRIVDIAGVPMIISVAVELDTDHTHAMEVAKTHGGGYTLAQAMQDLNWSSIRAARATDALVREGMCWVDKQTYKDNNSHDACGARDTYGYWIPSVWQDLRKSSALTDGS